MRPIDADAFEKRIKEGFDDCKEELIKQGKLDFAEQLTKAILFDIKEEPTLSVMRSNYICDYCKHQNLKAQLHMLSPGEPCLSCGPEAGHFSGKIVTVIKAE